MRYLPALLKLVLLLFVLIVGALLTYTYTHGDEIKAYLLKEINKQLLVQADVEEVEISLIQNFPNLSLILSDVHLHQEDKSIVKAKEIRVKFSLADLLDQRFELHSLAISEGQLELIEDAEGEFFPGIWKADTNRDQDQKLSFQLKLRKVSLSHIKVHYAEKDAKTEFDLLIKSAWAKGQFDQENYELAWNSSIGSFNFYSSGKPSFVNESFGLQAICKMDKQKQSLSISKVDLSWQSLSLSANGLLNYADGVDLFLEFQKEATALSNYYPLFSDKVVRQLDSLSISSTIELNGTLKGELSPNFKPEFELNYQVKNGRLLSSEAKIKISALMMYGRYQHSNLVKAENGLLIADSIAFKLNEMNFRGKGAWKNDQSEPIYLNGNLSGELSQLNSWSDSSDFKFKSGKFFAEIDGTIKLDELEEYNWDNWKRSNNSIYLEVSDASLEFTEQSKMIEALNAKIALGQNDLYAEKLSLKFDGKQMEYQGKALNLISHLSDPSKTLLIQGKASSPNLRLEDIFALGGGESKDDQKREYRIFLQGKVDRLYYKELGMSDISFSLRGKQDQWLVEDIRMQTLDGTAEGKMSINIKANEVVELNSRASLSAIDIHKLFVAFNDFEQDEIKAENLYGTASAEVDLFCRFTKGEVDKKSLQVDGLVDIVNGKLLEYQSLYQLSKYIELKELRNIEFKRLQNRIKIENEEVYLPNFSIRSSAIDVEIEGTHSFENIVDYHISLRLDQILGKKAKKPKESEFGYIEDDGLGKTQLFLRMQGDISDPRISYDKSQLKDHWKSEVEKEKQNLKGIFKEEFGLFKKDSSLSSPVKTETPAKFQIEWDESAVENEEKLEEDQAKSSQTTEKKAKKKGRFGKFIDKIAKPNEDEYVEPQN